MHLDFASAKRKAVAKLPRSRFGKKISILSEGTPLIQLGRAPFLFLNFFKWMILYVFLLVLVQIPHVYFFYQQETKENIWYRLSMANWDSMYKDEKFTLLVGGDIRINIGLGVAELALCIITICFIRFILWYLERKSRLASESVITVADFSVHVSGVPPDQVRDVNALAKYFSMFGPIKNVAIALDSGNINKLKKEKEKAEKKIRSYEVRAKKGGCNAAWYSLLLKYYQWRLSSLTRKIDYRMNQKAYKCVGHAFITFRNERSRYKCLHAFNRPIIENCLCCCCPPRIPAFGHKVYLRVDEPEEPANIVWENMEYTKASRILRRSVSLFMAVICIAAATAVAALGEIEKQRTEAGKDQSKDFDFRDILSTYDVLFSLDALKTYGISIVVFLTSQLLSYVLYYLSSFEKHKFDSRRKRSMMYKIAFGQFLITAAVLFVQTQVIDQIPGIIPYIKVIVERTVFYYTLFILMITNVGTMIIKEMLLGPWHWIKRVFKASRAMNQEELEDSLEPPIYSLEYRYSALLKNILVGLMFSGMWPPLLWILLVGLLVSYFVDKYNLLNVYQKTGDAEDLLAMAAVKVVSIGWLLRYVAIAVLRVYRAVSSNNYYNGYMLMLTISFAIFVVYLIFQFTVPDFKFLNRLFCAKYRYRRYHTQHGKVDIDTFKDLDVYKPPVTHNEVKYVYAGEQLEQTKRGTGRTLVEQFGY